MFMGLCIVNVT